MFGLLMGFALGGMAFTEKGRELGNQMWDYGANAAKKAVNRVQQKPTEQPTGAAGDDSYTG